jgi:hypothetical protein
MLATIHSNLRWRIKSLFEFSLFDIILMAGIFILIVLYVALVIRLKPSLKIKKESSEKDADFETPRQSPKEKPPGASSQPTTRLQTKEKVEKLPTSAEPPEAPKAETQTPKRAALYSSQEALRMKEILIQKAKASQKGGPPGCSYYFGFLGELPKNTPIPDACLGCLKIMECLIKRPTNSGT